MKQLAVVAILFSTACKEQPKPRAETSPRGNACTSALASFDRFVEIPDADAAQRAQVKAALLARCIDDAWSEPAVACMRKADTSHAMFECWDDLLTKEQRDAARQALATMNM